MKRVRFFAVILAAAVLSGCAESEHAPETGARIITSFKNVCHNGELYKDGNGRLNFFDFETMQSALLCARPNCAHTDENECSAFGMDNFPIMYGDKLYFFDTEIIFGDDDIREDTTIYRADPDGTNRTALYTIEGFNIETARIILVGDTAYFALRRIGWSEDMTMRNGREYLWFASYDIPENKFTMIEKLCEGYGTGTYMYGLWNGGLHFFLGSSEEPWDPDDPLGENKQWDEHMIVYDIAEGTLRDSGLPEPFSIGGGYYIYGKDGGIEILGEDGTEKHIDGLGAPGYTVTPVNGKIIDMFKGVWLDPKTGETGAVKRIDGLTKWHSAAAFYDGCYIFRRYTGDGMEYVKVAEDELF